MREEAAEMASIWKEVGTTGLETAGGFINEAFTRELEWPGVEPLYSRIWRSDPEVMIIRNILEDWAGAIRIGPALPEAVGGRRLPDTSEDDRRALDFAWEVLEDIEGGISRWLKGCITRVPFYGWGWWEAPLGLRRAGWRPPGGDPWRSQFNDGLIGYRRLAFRRYSSFFAWEMNEGTGRVLVLKQLDMPEPIITIPIDRSLHVIWGDQDNPEGLAGMEALWRLERIKYGLEKVMGIGFEHSAGYLSVTIEEGSYDKEAVKKAARNIMTAQEGNYAAWPKGTKGEIIDVPFQAADSILRAIRYFGILKLALWGMQFVSMASLSEHGSYSAMKDASTVAINIFNSIATGIVQQLDEQLGKRLFEQPANREAFQGMTRRPRFQVIEPLTKELDLEELGGFVGAMEAVMPLSEADLRAIRRRSGILPGVEGSQIDAEAPANEDRGEDPPGD
jgi:hypothetical protein